MKQTEEKVTEKPKADALATTARPGALARPSFIAEGDVRGTQDIGKDDIQMPRLALAQALSPEVDSTNQGRYIEGLRIGDAFNNLTRDVYGKDPLDVVVIRAEPTRFVEFHPRESGGGIKDWSVPAGDPRTKFQGSEKPVATKFQEYVALLGPQREPIALSFKGSGLRTARQLSSLIKLRGLPSFASVFTLTPVIEKNTKGTYAVFVVKLKGNVDEETYTKASALYDFYKGRELAADAAATEAGAEEEVPF